MCLLWVIKKFSYSKTPSRQEIILFLFLLFLLFLCIQNFQSCALQNFQCLRKKRARREVDNFYFVLKGAQVLMTEEAATLNFPALHFLALWEGGARFSAATATPSALVPIPSCSITQSRSTLLCQLQSQLASGTSISIFLYLALSLSVWIVASFKDTRINHRYTFLNTPVSVTWYLIPELSNLQNRGQLFYRLRFTALQSHMLLQLKDNLTSQSCWNLDINIRYIHLNIYMYVYTYKSISIESNYYQF